MALDFYLGEKQAFGFDVVGDPVSARASFLARLTGVYSEGFESFAFATKQPLALNFTGSSGTLTATLTDANLAQVENRTSAGRFNTTPGGSKWWDTSGQFTITFGTPISAFGFYGTDIGDANGQIAITATKFGGGTVNWTINNTVLGVTSGALLFWGFVDTTNRYTQLVLDNTGGTGIDYFGFDDMVIGDRTQIDYVAPPAPAPSSSPPGGATGIPGPSSTEAVGRVPLPMTCVCGRARLDFNGPCVCKGGRKMSRGLQGYRF